MANAGQFLSRLVTVALNRDGQADALDPNSGALDELKPDPGGAVANDGRTAERAASRRHRPSMPPERILLESIAVKVLHAWLQNRHQTLVPLTINFRNLDARQAELIVHAMAAAALADGQIDEREQSQVLASLQKVGAGEAEACLFREAVANPRPLATLLRDLQDANLGAYAYAASLLAVNQRNRVNRLYLDYLAARLGLSVDVVHSLNRRYRV